MSRRHLAPKAVVFDLDGTLVDSMPMVLKAYAHALAPFHPPLTEADLFRQLGGPPERMFRDLFGEGERTAEALRRLVEYSRTHWHLIQPFAGAHPLLAELREAERGLGLWTGRDRGSTEMILREQRLGEGLREIVCGDDLDTHKPHPGGLRQILDRLAVEPAETLFVGDADVDVLAGAALGVPVVLIRHGREVGEPVAAKAWRVVDTPTQAYAAIREALGG